MIRLKQNQTAFLSAGLICLLLLALSPLGFFFGTMGIASGNHGGDCPFGAGFSVCTMNPLGYITAWQSRLTSLPHQNPLLALLLLLMATTSALSLLYRWSIIIPALPKHKPGFAHRISLPIPLPLTEVFSRGILHTKAF